jgi:glucokinase
VKELPKTEHWVGVDLGGTWLRVAISNDKGKFVERVDEEVDKRSADAINKQIVRIVLYLCGKNHLKIHAIKGVGIASAGPLVQDKGILVRPVNLPFDRVPLTKPIAEQLEIPTCLINDCAGAALGERMFGAARGIDNFVYITISTGIGAGAIVNGTLLLGKDGNGHEVGHFVIDYEGKLLCGCGRPGHWEGYCSGRNIPNFVRMRLKDMPIENVKESLLFRMIRGDFSRLATADLFRAAKKHDGLSLQLINEIGILNAIGVANVVNAYDPSLITIGGTVALKNKQMILSPIRKHVHEYALNRVPRIQITPLGDDVCLYGAVAAAMNYLR